MPTNKSCHPDVWLDDSGRPIHVRNCKYYTGRGTYSRVRPGYWRCACDDEKTDQEIFGSNISKKEAFSA